MSEITLSEVLVGLRRELKTAQVLAKQESLQFRVDQIEVEIKLGVTRKETGKGGIDFKVLNLGGEIGEDHQSVQTLRLTLTPEGPDGELKVSDTDDK